MPTTKVTTESGDGWAILTLSSPAGLNKLGSDTLAPLLEQVTDALDSGARCLGITGEGGSFAVGADLKEIGTLTPLTARAFSDQGNRIFRLLEGADAAVVAGIDGFCLGGGLDLALAADWRVAADRSLFGHPGADLGLITGFGGTQRLPRLIGQRAAARCLYTSRRLDSDEAYRLGLVQEVCTREKFQERFRQRVAAFADLEPGLFRELKRYLSA
ncbi:MAG: enoyl-CoA hydratase/isomerase family protein [bacterium]|nr:enoyl-CoA hydratase/isomerase family protein [bacterium]